MKLLITGCKGQLGNELQRQLKNAGSVIGAIPAELAGADVTAVDIDVLDLTDRAAVLDFCKKNRFDAIINCAAFTNVDGCETDPNTAFRANSLAPKYLAEAARETGAKLLHVSTDYVFAGDAAAPYTEASLPAPATSYGRTKLLGESYVRENAPKYFIVRTAWLYGLVGKNFVKTIIGIAKEKGALSVVNDQLGNPTSAVDLAHHILKLIVTDDYGVYHCTCSGVCSWYDFAAEIVRLSGIDASVAPCTTDESARPAKRPAYSALDNAMLRATVGDETRDWQSAIAEYINTPEIGELIR